MHLFKIKNKKNKNPPKNYLFCVFLKKIISIIKNKDLIINTF